MTDGLKTELESSDGRRIFADFLGSIGKADTLEKFDMLTDLYYQVNSVVNISGLKTVDDVYIKHYLDSAYHWDKFSGTVCDVGSGGGVPCLPLAILTDCEITGLDSVGKKLLLIDRAKTELGLKNIKTDHARSEDLAKLGRRFDTVCARALADVDKALSYCAPLAKTDGRIILYRTQNESAANAQTINKFKVKLKETVDHLLPGTDIKRRLLVYEKN
ncbi:MAG: 16S rRNA (guanine(527)-N(7))-methyltransferase RsmG [Clostridia bacterium]|nr:16S rRNA (guanine(527)-N(7))-methyltransferase RsmG [Clostridia bacterium]